MSQTTKETESLNFNEISSLAGNIDGSAIKLNNLGWELNRFLLSIGINPFKSKRPAPKLSKCNVNKNFKQIKAEH